ncbi:MAG TPA: hypothetical protein VNY84_15640, partial [Acidimicrobiales bacterium]|nr:hypothetical protein [Acidimicrobiales bacterium]
MNDLLSYVFDLLGQLDQGRVVCDRLVDDQRQHPLGSHAGTSGSRSGEVRRRSRAPEPEPITEPAPQVSPQAGGSGVSATGSSQQVADRDGELGARQLYRLLLGDRAAEPSGAPEGNGNDGNEELGQHEL